jgi:epoxyqueuosine reductase
MDGEGEWPFLLMRHIKELVREEAFRLGFDLFGVTRLDLLPDTTDRWKQYIRDGRHGRMGYIAHTYKQRAVPGPRFSWCRSVVMVGAAYRRPAHELAKVGAPPRPDPAALYVARYARGLDYHGWMTRRLDALSHALEARHGAPVRTWSFCDTAGLPEKPLAWLAGLGRLGRSTLLITPRYGSWIVLGGLLLGIELPADAPSPSRCPAGCARCLEACPTGALDARGVDATRCLAYWTTDAHRPTPEEIAPAVEDRLYGCDRCQDACPANQGVASSRHPAFDPGRRRRALDLEALRSADDARLDAICAGSPAARGGAERLRRNLDACATSLRPERLRR